MRIARITIVSCRGPMAASPLATLGIHMSAHRKFGKFVVSPLAGALALAVATPALADPAGEPMQATDIDKVEVHGQYVEKPTSVKYTEPLLDTPQTITVVTQEV